MLTSDEVLTVLLLTAKQNLELQARRPGSISTASSLSSATAFSHTVLSRRITRFPAKGVIENGNGGVIGPYLDLIVCYTECLSAQSFPASLVTQYASVDYIFSQKYAKCQVGLLPSLTPWTPAARVLYSCYKHAFVLGRLNQWSKYWR